MSSKFSSYQYNTLILIFLNKNIAFYKKIMYFQMSYKGDAHE